jgi:hypothetical protein
VCAVAFLLLFHSEGSWDLSALTWLLLAVPPAQALG